MFTGIIEGIGVLRRITNQGQGRVLTIETDVDLHESKIGDSIAVNGACLTAVKLQRHLFEVDMAPETVNRTTFKSIATGERLNIERAMRLSDRLDGHLVSGHIDGTGRILSKTIKSNAVIITIEVPSELACQMIEKGSVAVDGISLTINRCTERDFQISVIPHTAGITTIGIKGVGDEVNIETDMLGKYVRRFFEQSSSVDVSPVSAHNGVSMELLARNGFL